MTSRIGFFPKLYKDELLYSWLARYHVQSLNEGPKTTMNDLFNKQSQVAVPDMPCNLFNLYIRINDFINISLDELIMKHTFFSYYTRFTSVNNQAKILELMKTGSDKNAIHMATGVMASGIKEKDHFYFCPECVLIDELNLGETYWRLHHQLPGVLVCRLHKCELQKSSVPFRPHNRHEYIAADFDNCVVDNATIKFNERDFYHLLKLTEKFEFLRGDSLSFYQSLYKNKLSEHGFMKPSGRIDQRLLSERFNDFYGASLLRTLQSDVNYFDSSCWLKAITRKHRKTFHPIRHLLLLNFLEEIAFSNVGIHRQTNPFGEGPYPCFNKASTHYKQLLIDKVDLSFCSETKQPIGLFKCECGFEYYSKEFQQENGLPQLKISKIKEFGEVWKNKLNKLTSNDPFSFRRVAKKLGVDTKTVIKYYRLSRNTENVEKNIKDKIQILEKKKQDWLKLIEKYLKMNITELRTDNQALYMYLYRNDKEWLQENSPIRKKKRQNRKSNVNWVERDEFYSAIIYEKIEELLKQEPPVRITISKIGTELGIRSFLQKRLNKLPKTQDLINQMVESIESFQIRRVQYISTQLINDEGSALDWKIRRLAGLRKNLDDLVENVISQIIN